ncbi:MAG: hypothetical protein KGO05_14150, partial [Chloroflexota bacterium]|nr:hypothetical protein [Chloroflexota bacterium]
DLNTQMPYLPRFMQAWPRDEILNWLRLYGEVKEPIRAHTLSNPAMLKDMYYFRSRHGPYCTFILLERGAMFIPGTRTRAWEAPEPV